VPGSRPGPCRGQLAAGGSGGSAPLAGAAGGSGGSAPLAGAAGGSGGSAPLAGAAGGSGGSAPLAGTAVGVEDLPRQRRQLIGAGGAARLRGENTVRVGVVTQVASPDRAVQGR